MPEDVTDETQMEEFCEKGKAFCGYTIDLSNDITPLNKLFPKPVHPAGMNKILWDYIKSKKEGEKK